MDSQTRPSAPELLNFFTRSLSSFESSPGSFQILDILPSPFHHTGVRECKGQKILVLDSSFNPPTKAHAQMAGLAMRWMRQQQQQQQQKQVRLMLLLAVNNADKEAKPAGFAQRLGMMDWFARMLLDECRDHDVEMAIDLAVTKLPYFSDKAQAIVQTLDAETQPELIFLVGFDTITRIFNPKYYTSSGGMKHCLAAFFQHARLRVTCRPDDDEWGNKAQQEAYVRDLADNLEQMGGDAAWASRIDLEDGDVSELEEDVVGGVSSSKVREMVKKGEMEELKGLVDEGVREWIERECLYR